MAFVEDDSAWMNFLPLKRRKIENDIKPKRKRKNNISNAQKKLVLKKKNTLMFEGGNLKAEEVCPSCQLPFTLIVASQKHHHVIQCLDTKRNNILECPDGNACNSTVTSHFKDFTHYQLAEFRATAIENISQKCETVTENVDNKSEALNESKCSDLIEKSLPEFSDSQKENGEVENCIENNNKKDHKQLDIRGFFGKQNITVENKIVQDSKLKVEEANLSKKSISSESQQSVQWTNKWWEKKRQNESDVKITSVKKKECPFYKKIPGTCFAIDAFSYGEIPNISFYFLTHFHADHYQGLNGKFKKSIYCSQVTANLINMQLKVSMKYINVLSLNTPNTIDGIEVIFLEANHCPGSVLILFRLPNGHNILHTGDFRAHPNMESYNSLKNINIDTLYLDTTYCHPKYDFPSQEAVINFSVNLAKRIFNEKPKTLFICGSYTIGKEKIFMGIAQELKLKVYASPNKLKVLTNLEDPSINAILAKTWEQAQVHVLPMQQLSYKALNDHLQLHSTNFTNIVAIKPTGWEYRKNIALDEIKARCSGNVTVYGLPYSEHSSFLELKRFVQHFRPFRIIPTVNVGKAEERDRMQECFRQWIKIYK